MEEMQALGRKKRTFAVGTLVVGLAVVFIGAGLVLANPARKTARDVTDVRQVVGEFGQRLKNVPLSGSEENARSAIQQNYQGYVQEGLLSQWLAHPVEAPGRLTSSPWPDRIEIESVTPQGSGFVVNAKIILMTSAELATGEGAAGVIPVVMQVIKEGDTWVIVAYQEQAPQS